MPACRLNILFNPIHDISAPWWDDSRDGCLHNIAVLAVTTCRRSLTLDMAESIESPLLASDNNPERESQTLQGPSYLSKSPRQYAQRYPEEFSVTLKADDHFNPNSSGDHNISCRNRMAMKDFVDSDSRKRRKVSSTPSDTGSEADDESGPLLKSLPAPPLRLRKGLKNETAIGTPSPLLTPSYLDDEKRRETFEASFKRRASLQSHISTDEETLTIRDKFRKRRRAELIRRLTETLLLLSVGFVACWRTLLLPLHKGKLRSNSQE